MVFGLTSSMDTCCLCIFRKLRQSEVESGVPLLKSTSGSGGYIPAAESKYTPTSVNNCFFSRLFSCLLTVLISFCSCLYSSSIVIVFL